jgi:hypothetical protein
MLRFTCKACALPADSVLAAYAGSSAYTDCYVGVLPRAVAQSEYVEAFYTTPVFKIERWLIARFLSRPSTDAQIRQLANGELRAFAAWTVEQRKPDQLMLAAGPTRSWLMASASNEHGGATTLYFGSAVLPGRSRSSGKSTMGWWFRALLGFHKLYSRVLLRAALTKLGAKG